MSYQYAKSEENPFMGTDESTPFNSLASLCSWRDWFEPGFVEPPKAGFVASRLDYNIITVLKQVSFS